MTSCCFNILAVVSTPAEDGELDEVCDSMVCGIVEQEEKERRMEMSWRKEFDQKGMSAQLLAVIPPCLTLFVAFERLSRLIRRQAVDLLITGYGIPTIQKCNQHRR